MIPKIIACSLIAATIIVTFAIGFTQQETKAENEFNVYQEKFNDKDWNNDITKLLPREGDLGREWKLLWSDGSEKFSEGESPIIIKKTISDNEILSTSYNYMHIKDGTFQILIWKGGLLEDWSPHNTVQSIFAQTDAKIEKILTSPNSNTNCINAYYDYYGNDEEIKMDLLFSECAKEDYRIRVNLIDGEYNKNSFEKIILLTNLTLEKIQ